MGILEFRTEKFRLLENKRLNHIILKITDMIRPT